MPHQLLAYVGPETALPIVSALTAIGGALLLFGRSCWGLIGRSIRRLLPGCQVDDAVLAEEDG